jgi:hypothetical protein
MCEVACRPGVFYVTKADGRLEVWDYFYKQNEPSLTLHVSDHSLASLKLQVHTPPPPFPDEDQECRVHTKGYLAIAVP